MTYNELWHRLVPLYTSGEAKAIVRWVLEQTFGFTLTQVLSGKVSELSPEQEAFLEEIIIRLEKAEPVQYVLGKELFFGRTYAVERRVLIPRPETELLCQYIIDYLKQTEVPRQTILDIGTGSGCIAITLALELHDMEIHGWDISEAALTVAKNNAKNLGAKVKFHRKDIFNASADRHKWDVIVSNPPYICNQEKARMHPNVLQYEPDLALFVPDNDPLKYYKAIASYAKGHLKQHGTLWLEINPVYHNDLCTMLQNTGFTAIYTLNDQQQDLRFIKATLENETTE